MSTWDEYRATLARINDEYRQGRAKARTAPVFDPEATRRVGEAILAENPRTHSAIWEGCDRSSLEAFRKDAESLTGDLTEIRYADWQAADWQTLYDSYKDY